MKANAAYLVSIIVLALAPLAAPAQEFSADLVTHDTSSGRTTRGKVYRGASMIRAEATPQSGNATDPGVFLIVDVAQQKSYTIVSSRKAIMVAHGRAALNKASIALPFNENPCVPSDGGTLPSGSSCKELGEETVNGRHTVKWAMSETLGGHPATQYVWVDPKLHCLVKIQAWQSTVELQNIQEGPQPALLFALPTGYQTMDVGGH
jgi:hypothetical protein